MRMRRGNFEDPDHTLPAAPLPPDELAHAGECLISAGSGWMRAMAANAMVGLSKEYYGRGPTAAKAWFLNEYILVAMEGGLTRNEETLLAAGQQDLVRRYRLAFQEAMTATTTARVEEITGRRVAAYHSQIVFEPTRAFELF